MVCYGMLSVLWVSKYMVLLCISPIIWLKPGRHALPLGNINKFIIYLCFFISFNFSGFLFFIYIQYIKTIYGHLKILLLNIEKKEEED